MDFNGSSRARGAAPLSLVALGLLLAFGCGRKEDAAANGDTGDAHEDPKPRTFAFACDGDELFTAQITEDGERVVVFLPETRLSLPRVRSASGEKFDDGVRSLSIKGQEAILQLENESYRNCVNDTREAVWEEARLRGADFRATGNEPGWTLEMFKRSRAHFVMNYGEEVYEFRDPDRHDALAPNATALRYTNGEHELVVEIRNALCSDSMSGARGGAAVLLIFDGRQLTGCGRVLRGPRKT